MKTIFSELYNKILELFQIDKSENTGECAANRLQVILMHDRTKLDPLIMAKMREEIIEVFSKYVVIDKEKLEIDLTNEGDAAALMLNIPIVRAKTEEELEEIRKRLQEEEQKVKEEDDDEIDSEDEQPETVDGEVIVEENDNIDAETNNETQEEIKEEEKEETSNDE